MFIFSNPVFPFIIYPKEIIQKTWANLKYMRIFPVPLFIMWKIKWNGMHMLHGRQLMKTKRKRFNKKVKGQLKGYGL